MKASHRARQVGITAVACALTLRFFAAGFPEKLYYRFLQPNIDAFMAKAETGQDVRFSSSLDIFSPDFMESPPPSLPVPTEAPLPAFSGEEPVNLFYAAEKQPDIASLLAKPLQWDLFSEEPTVLILHTHATESYTRQDEDYKETASWRTLDPDYNMVSIGKRVADLLQDKGIAVIQDDTTHDYPSYNGSYARSRQTIREYSQEYRHIRLILDLHRDAAGDADDQLRTRAEVEGIPSAQLMIVIGTNHDAYEENLSLGLKLHVQLQQQSPGIMRPLQLRSQRFNQDLNPGALLIEVGAAGNSHDEALVAAEQLANAIIALAKGTASGDVPQ